MRKLSTKWPRLITFSGIIIPVCYVLVRLVNPEYLETFSFKVFLTRLFGVLFIIVPVWMFYGLACLFARRWECCCNCKFSEALDGTEELRCCQTGYTYPETYTCKISEPK